MLADQHFPLIFYYYIIRAQFLGVFAQVLSALPMLLISVLLAQTVGLSAVAEFALAAGLSAVLFTLALQGLRTAMLKDRFATIEFRSYVVARLAGAAFLIFAALILAAAFNISFILVAIVIFLRVGDMALDLTLAIDQVRRSEKEHLYGYLQGQLVKFATIGIAAAYIWGTGAAKDPLPIIALAAAAYCGVTFWVFVARHARMLTEPKAGSEGPLLGQLRRLFRMAAPFLGAQLICALLTVFPRITLGWYKDEIAAGTTASALTVATLAGMIFYAIWLRWSPRLGRDGLKPSNILRFLSEATAILVLMLLLTVLFGGRVTAVVYGITAESQIAIVTQTLIWSAIFFAAMTTANLFKFSRQPWIESLTYVIGLIAAALVAFQRVETSVEIDMTELLIAATLAMLVVQLVAGLFLQYSGQPE